MYCSFFLAGQRSDLRTARQ